MVTVTFQWQIIKDLKFVYNLTLNTKQFKTINNYTFNSVYSDYYPHYIKPSYPMNLNLCLHICFYLDLYYNNYYYYTLYSRA